MFRNALVSVSDKAGLVEFLKPYVAKGLRVVSTGGTLRHLRENGIAAVDVAEQTGFPEVMDGRVKTLHPRVHMALLARRGHPEDEAILQREKLDAFDLVIVNLYPFEEARRKNLQGDELIEFIDIGGPSLLRAAAKNHERLAVVCEPEDYKWIAEKSELTIADRRRLAARVFRHTSRYDDLIAKTLGPDEKPESISGRLVASLRYGENPQQKAWWYRQSEAKSGLQDAEILHGKPLSYNNLLDLDAAVGTVQEFIDPAAVAVKHNNPCGVGTGASVSEAVLRAIQSDPLSVFGGIIAINRTVDAAAAEEMSKIFLECIIAPEFQPEALERLKKKKDLRLLRWPQMAKSSDRIAAAKEPAQVGLDQYRTISGGFLVQTPDLVSRWSQEWQVLGQQPSESIKKDLLLAWITCACLKSNAIAIASEGRTVGLGMGQVNRVDAVEQAIQRMHKHHSEVREPVLASDAFFPFPDSIELAARAGIRWIVQPGGSIRDEDVKNRAGELGINMILTGVRHFRH